MIHTCHGTYPAYTTLRNAFCMQESTDVQVCPEGAWTALLLPVNVNCTLSFAWTAQSETEVELCSFFNFGARRGCMVNATPQSLYRWVYVLNSCNKEIKLGGTQWRSWFGHRATSRKVAGSICDGAIGIFHWHNPSGRTVALRSTQSLTEMSTRNISWG